MLCPIGSRIMILFWLGIGTFGEKREWIYRQSAELLPDLWSEKKKSYFLFFELFCSYLRRRERMHVATNCPVCPFYAFCGKHLPLSTYRTVWFFCEFNTLNLVRFSKFFVLDYSCPAGHNYRGVMFGKVCSMYIIRLATYIVILYAE